MAMSTCVKCDNHIFETVVKEPTNSHFKLIFVQCASCGGVVGVTEFYNTGELVTKLAKKLNVKIV